MYSIKTKSELIFQQAKFKTLSVDKIFEQLKNIHIHLDNNFSEINNFVQLLNLIIDKNNDFHLDLLVAELFPLKHSLDDTGLSTLFRRTQNDAAMIAVMMNPNFFNDGSLGGYYSDDDIKEIIQDNENFAVCILSNPNISNELMEYLISILPDKFEYNTKWSIYLETLISNKVLNLYGTNDANNLGWKYNDKFSEDLWYLINNVPVCYRSAVLLRILFLKVAIEKSKTVQKTLLNNIKFPTSKPEPNELKTLFSKWICSNSSIDPKLSTYAFAFRADLSQLICTWYPSDFLSNNDDLAIRIGYYRSANLTTEEMKLYFEKDHLHFLQALIDGMNKSIFISRDNYAQFEAINPLFSDEISETLRLKNISKDDISYSVAFQNSDTYDNQIDYPKYTIEFQEWFNKEYKKLFEATDNN